MKKLSIALLVVCLFASLFAVAAVAENEEDYDLSIFESGASSVNEDAIVTRISDDMVQITIPYPRSLAEEDFQTFQDDMSILIPSVYSGLDSCDYKFCNIACVDNDEVYMGVSIKKNGDVSTYYIEE